MKFAWRRKEVCNKKKSQHVRVNVQNDSCKLKNIPRLVGAKSHTILQYQLIPENSEPYLPGHHPTLPNFNMTETTM